MMGLHKWSLLWSLVVCQTMSISAAELTVGINESSCEHKTDVLFCDYKKSNQDTVKMNPISDDKLKKIFLYNINKLILSEPVCVSVALHNVKKVVIQKEANAKCNNTVELSAKKCNLESIPSQMTALYLEESVLDSLETDAAFSKISVISSNITTLKMTTSLAKETKGVIQDSRVSTLHKMVIDNGASLLIMKSTINTVNENSLEIKNGDVTVKDSIFIAAKGSVNIDAGGSLTVGNQQGDITVTGWSEMRNIELPNTGHSGSFLAPFVICLILLLISWLVMILIVIYFRKMLLDLLSKNKEMSINGSVSELTQKLLRVKVNNDVKKASSEEKDKENHEEQKETAKKSITRQVKNETAKFVKRDKEINNKINSERSKEKIEHLFEKLLLGYKFHGVLQAQEATVIACLVHGRWDITENKNDKATAAIRDLNRPDETTQTCRDRFNIYEEYLNKIISLLTTFHKKEEYVKTYQMTDKTADCFKELAESIAKDKSKKKEALQYCAQKITENNQSFKAAVLELFDKELKTRIQRTQKIIEYMMAQHPQINQKLPENSPDKLETPDHMAEKTDNEYTEQAATKAKQPNPNVSERAIV